MPQTSRKSSTKTRSLQNSPNEDRAQILALVGVQLDAQAQTIDEAYEVAAAHRDALIAGLSPRARVHAKLAMGICDRLLNPVR